jgi:hypothetical protein
MFIAGVDFIGNEKMFLFAFADNVRHNFIQRRNSFHRIHHEQDDIRFLYRDFHLPADLRFEHIFRSFRITAGIDHGKLPAVPFRMPVVPVARNARNSIHNSLAMTN